jgi:hypothetical protein
MFLDARNSAETSQDYKDSIALQERKFDKKWGPIFIDFKKEDKMSIAHNFFFIVRRQIFVMIIFWIPFPAI